MTNPAHRTDPRFLLGTLAAALGFGLLLAAAPQAQAGGYWIHQCGGLVQGTSETVLKQLPSAHVDLYNDCLSSPGDVHHGIIDKPSLIADAKHERAGRGDIGGWSFESPSGAMFDFVSAKIYHHRYNGKGRTPTLYYSGDGPLFTGDVKGGWETKSSARFGTKLQSFIECRRSSGCGKPGDVMTSVRNITLHVSDTTAPSTPALSGQLFGPDPVGGDQVPMLIESSDHGGGINRFTVSVNGTEIVDRSLHCEGLVSAEGQTVSRLARPCPLRPVIHAEADATTPPFREGSNRVRVCAYDLAVANSGSAPANRTCTERSVEVDHHANPPEELTVSHYQRGELSPYTAGESVAGNEFIFDWQNLDDDIAAAEFSYLALAGSFEFTKTEVRRDQITQLNLAAEGIDLPGPGCYATSITLIDRFANRSEPSPTKTVCYEQEEPRSTPTDLRVTHAITGNHPYRGEEMPNGSFRLAWQNTEPDIAGAKLRISRYRDRPEGETREGWERLAISRTTKTFSGENLRRIDLRGRGLRRPGCYALELRLTNQNGRQSGDSVEPQSELCVRV